jgi:hypothetical protein
VSFAAPISLLIAALVLGGAVVIMLLRQPGIRRPVRLLVLGGAAMLTVAAGDPSVRLPRRGQVIVIVDARPAPEPPSSAMNDRFSAGSTSCSLPYRIVWSASPTTAPR